MSTSFILTKSEQYMDDRGKIVKINTVIGGGSGGGGNYQHKMKTPFIPMEMWELLHNFSMFMIMDDIHDFGYTSYFGREGHFYNGQERPDHPSPFHHWQIGLVGVILSQVGALATRAMDMMSAFREEEGEEPLDITPLQYQHNKRAVALPPPTNQKNKFNQLLDEIDSI